MKLLLSLLLAIPLIACSNQTTAEKPSPNSEYKSPGKPSAKVQLNYKLSKERVAVGETVDLTINFSGNMPSKASIKTSKQLILQGNKQFQSKNGSIEKQVHTFSVTPTTEGIHLVTIIAEDAQTSHKKPFAIRVIAGDKPIEEYLENNGTLETDENGEKIISMPAEKR